MKLVDCFERGVVYCNVCHDGHDFYGDGENTCEDTLWTMNESIGFQTQIVDPDEGITTHCDVDSWGEDVYGKGRYSPQEKTFSFWAPNCLSQTKFNFILKQLEKIDPEAEVILFGAARLYMK